MRTPRRCADKWMNGKEYRKDNHQVLHLLSKEPIPKVIFKSHTPVKGCVLGLANVESWDNIVKKFKMKTPERCAEKSKGKRKV
nr:hypothetical protein [Tanacetum cinerariifolium]